MKYKLLLLLLAILLLSACATNNTIRKPGTMKTEESKESAPDVSVQKKSDKLISQEDLKLKKRNVGIQTKGDYILVIKHLFKLFHYRDGVLLKDFYIAIGLNPGDKQAVGDYRTPIGIFPIVGIEDSSEWEHDFNDGLGSIKNAYGPWFIRLLTNPDTTVSKRKWTGIGIHGTHNPNSIGTRATEGCIRLRNADLIRMVQALPDNGQGAIVEIIE
ncbi:MAG: L,D-transpeptidase [Candidatus Zophobacter franzmannii]|nr:L,D-transpeptidase [Candidatus Zophobacter franzmannii]